MKNTLILIACAMVASSCGGGGSLSDLDSSYDNSGINSNETIKQFSDGSAVVATKGNIKSLATIDEPSYYFSITNEPDSLIQTFNGAVNLRVTDSTDFGGTNYYRYVYDGTTSQGKNIEAVSIGYFLDGSGNQVSVTVATLNNDEVFLLSSGTLAKTLPAGKHIYSFGDIIMAYRDSGAETSFDKITVAVDFDKSTGSLVAETDSMFASADGFLINKANGTFSGTDATIGFKGGSDRSAADIIGGFSGVGATGVHGLIYTDEGDFASDVCDSCGTAVFYAIK